MIYQTKIEDDFFEFYISVLSMREDDILSDAFDENKMKIFGREIDEALGIINEND